ncbi:MAG: hypothetical protein DI596_13075, partial [Azospira oryzae]
AQVLLRTRSEGARVDHHGSAWNTPMPAQPVPGGVISGRLRDLNGCFNLNNLAPGRPDLAAWQRVFRRLALVRGADPALTEALTDWLGGGAGSDEGAYLAQPVPYRPARRAFAHASELRLVRGVGSETYARLAPYVCALPAGTRLNVNTAGVPLLMALADTVTQSVAEREPGVASVSAPVRDALRVPLIRLCARYLVEAKEGGRPLDPVARFHLGNGARLERINWLADTSPKGMRQSLGLMVNYLYDLKDIEDNHERYARSGEVVVSGAVKSLLKQGRSV